MNVKQVIVIRKDLGMRRGKEIAQGSHASMEWLRRKILENTVDPGSVAPHAHWADLSFDGVEFYWLAGNFRKITLQVQSEAELVALHEAAKAAGLESHLIEDAGLTEFKGVPTKTALAIGPDLDEAIDPITSHLKLY